MGGGYGRSKEWEGDGWLGWDGEVYPGLESLATVSVSGLKEHIPHWTLGLIKDRYHNFYKITTCITFL